MSLTPASEPDPLDWEIEQYAMINLVNQMVGLMMRGGVLGVDQILMEIDRTALEAVAATALRLLACEPTKGTEDE